MKPPIARSTSGSHLVDQILWLLGPAVSVDAQLDLIDLPQGTTDAGFTITLRHESRVHSHLSASKLNRLTAKEYLAYGEAGSYVSSGTDVPKRRRSSPAAAPSTTSPAGDTSARKTGERCGLPRASSASPPSRGATTTITRASPVP